MQVLLSEKEMEYVNTSVFGWEIKDDCPKDIKKEIEKKITIINQYNYKVMK